MSKSPQTSKSHAKDGSASSSRSSIAAAIFGMSKMSFSVAVPKAGKGSKSASTTARVAPKAIRNSALVSAAASTSAPSPPSDTPTNPKCSNVAVPNTMSGALDIFSMDATKIGEVTPLPKVGQDIESTEQLVACAELLASTLAGMSDSESASTIVNTDALTPSQIKWIQEMNERPLEKENIRRLMSQMVDRFIDLPIKKSDAIREIVLLGPVLDKELYRALLNQFLYELAIKDILSVDLLQGLVKLVEHAPPFYLLADVPIKILRAIRRHFKDSAQQETATIIHLTIAISKVLVIMVEGGAKDLNRAEEHEPLLEILSKLKKHTDPLVRYQVEYAYRALQLIPDDETLRHRLTRSGLGLIGGLMTTSGVIQLDFGGVAEGLPEVIKNGRELIEILKKHFGPDEQNTWFVAVRRAEAMVNEGRLVDFNRFICETDCCQEPFFQWGVCLIIGAMAIDPTWDTTTRGRAILLLGKMFESNSGLTKHRDVRRWILTLLHDISKSPKTELSLDSDNDMIKQQALNLALELEGRGDERAFALQHPGMIHCRSQTSSDLLNDDSNILELELVLDRLRYQRREMYSQHAVYIPPMSKPNLQASDENSKPLHDCVHQFLGGNGLVILILGDSGAGKSTFNARLEQDLWKAYKLGDPIPLFIDLKAVRHLDQNLIVQHLDSLNMFSESHIKKLRSREFVLICDGYDESQSRSNLYTDNQFNKPNQWKAKMVISCRTQYLAPGYRTYFTPQLDTVTHLDSSPAKVDPFVETVIIPFKLSQIREYIAQYTAHSDTSNSKLGWTTEQYMERLEKIDHIMDLIKNPFMLKMVLDVLPTMEPTTTEITRVQLYDKFVDLHYENELDRLIKQQGKMLPDRLATFKEMEELDFVELGIDFSKRLADAIFKEGNGVNSVEYGGIADSKSWKRDFFGPEPNSQLLRESSQVIRRTRAPDTHDQSKGRNNSAGNKSTFGFSHLSILEYFYALSIYDPREGTPELVSSDSPSPLAAVSPSLIGHPLGRRSLISEPAVLQFLADRVRHMAEFKAHLHAVVQLSKTDTSAGCAAANAITILIQAGEQFNGADLKGIRIPGADLSSGDFDSAQLQGADLRNTILRNVWLHQADLSSSQMEGVAFGEFPYLKEEDATLCCNFSPDGQYLAVGLRNGEIVVYDTSTWTKVLFRRDTEEAEGTTNLDKAEYSTSGNVDRTVGHLDVQTGAFVTSLSGHTDWVRSVAFSPSGNQIASCSDDGTVRLWNAQTGALVTCLTDRADKISSVAFSPRGDKIVSGGSDRTVRLWDAQTGALLISLSGHTDEVKSVAFSPSGDQIASCSDDGTVRLWDAQTGALVTCLSGHTGWVNSVAFSPSGRQIASGSDDRTVRLLDAQNGAVFTCLSGHTNDVLSMAFSPSGHQIASCSRDKTVRLWDTQTGALVASLSGHTEWVNSVAFSPSGHHIASCSHDGTVRLWDAQTGAIVTSLSGHNHRVNSVVFSPNSCQIASGSSDRTVRLWDAQTGALVTSLGGHAEVVNSVAFSTSGHQIASASFDKTVRLWDTQTGADVTCLSGHTDWVRSVAFSPSGYQIATGSDDETVRLWNAHTGALIMSLRGHTDRVRSVAFSPSGDQIASCSVDGTVRLWDAQTGALAASLSAHTHGVIFVVFSPSGHQIASGGYDGIVQLWDAQTGELVSSLKGHTSGVYSVAFSPSGHRIASGSDDKTVRLWDAHTGHCKFTLDVYQDAVFALAWKAAPDHMYLAVGSNDQSVRMWQVVEDDTEVKMRLKWRSAPYALELSQVSIQDVLGLSEMNRRLLKQRGAKDQL
ncbi:protein transport protein SEC13 [Entomortierella parvispora]|uniref:Protein transport protein SEC13 n=1 Tax=Entomortierella parvispora TaxID=205924 RepID=A0A9P3LRL0_9FUNG|nr:protein transport protein SEC13 [Entomortierella parvispora]